MMNRKISYLIVKQILSNKTKKGKELRKIFEVGIRTTMLIKTGHLEGYEEIINGATLGEFLFGLGEYNEKLLEKGENAKLIAWLVRVVTDLVIENLTQDEIFEGVIGTPNEEMWMIVALDEFYGLPLEESLEILKNAINKTLLQSGFQSVTMDYSDNNKNYKKMEEFVIPRYMA